MHCDRREGQREAKKLTQGEGSVKTQEEPVRGQRQGSEGCHCELRATCTSSTPQSPEHKVLGDSGQRKTWLCYLSCSVYGTLVATTGHLHTSLTSRPSTPLPCSRKTRHTASDEMTTGNLCPSSIREVVSQPKPHMDSGRWCPGWDSGWRLAGKHSR